MFDTILALTLPCKSLLECYCTLKLSMLLYTVSQYLLFYSDPDIDDALVSGQVNTMAEALLKLNIKPLKLDGE